MCIYFLFDPHTLLMESWIQLRSECQDDLVRTEQDKLKKVDIIEGVWIKTELKNTSPFILE